jgi:hypothetical protein
MGIITENTEDTECTEKKKREQKKRSAFSLARLSLCVFCALCESFFLSDHRIQHVVIDNTSVSSVPQWFNADAYRTGWEVLAKSKPPRLPSAGTT